MGVIILNTLDAGFKNSFNNYKTFLTWLNLEVRQMLLYRVLMDLAL